MGALANIAIVVVLAWVVRALLGAREVTWTRMLAAVLIGLSAGSTMSVLLLVDDPRELGTQSALPEGALTLAVPFSVLATMIAIVVFELFFSRPPRRRELRGVRPIQAIRRRVHIVQKGVIDRFRSLPMSRSAVLVGRTVSDIFTNALSITVMALTGLAVGWRIHTSLLEAAGGFLLLLAFAYAFSWMMAYVGLLVGSPEVVNNSSFMVIFPFTFVSNAFVPSENLPGVLQTIAHWNPVSSVVQATRELFGNVDPRGLPPEEWSLQNPVLYSLLWLAIILAIFIPLATSQYKRAASR